MTTNQERAIDLSLEVISWEAQSEDPVNIVQALTEAGLIAPDLPTPDKHAATGNPVWWAPATLGISLYPDGEIGMMVDFESEARYTPETARAQALNLLAAAEYAEGEA